MVPKGTACTRMLPEKHNTQYKHIVHRNRYNNKTQIQEESAKIKQNYNNHTVKLKIKCNKETDIGHNGTLGGLRVNVVYGTVFH